MNVNAVPESFVRPTEFSLPGGEWFIGAGLGLFVHWDHASQQGIEISWPIVGSSTIPGVPAPEGAITVGEYHASAATFNPQEWDAKALASLARHAGAQYVVFTARHHGGYSMFHTEHSDFGIQNSAFGRDITREFVEAIRAEGIKVGIYFSLPDWHHPDYPAFEDTDRPYPNEHWPTTTPEENTEKSIRLHRRPTPEQWERFQSYLRGQLTEVLSNYGTIDLLWFDGEWERSAQEWDTEGLRKLIKSLQPNVVINERLLGQGDYKTPEQAFPSVIPDGPWELCLTIGDVWAWHPKDTNNKSLHSLLTSLVEVVSRGGNLLLNIGPNGDGSLNPDQVERLEGIAEWMRLHEESVIGVSPTSNVDFYGPTTARPGTVYLHLVHQPVEEIIVRGLPVQRVKDIRLLATGEHLKYRAGVDVHEVQSHEEGPIGELRIPAPIPSGAPIDVVAIDFE